MKGINSTGALLVHVPGWVDGWMGGSKSRFKDCLQQSKREHPRNIRFSTVFGTDPTKPLALVLN
jgi:hypothetical protein